MGRASSSKKVSRAARAGGSAGAGRNLVWPATISLVVLLGVGLIAVSAIGRDGGADDRPIIGDHWHAAYGVYTCDEFAAPFNDAIPDESGIHAHGDGLMHLHPFSTRFTGEDANIAAFAETTAFELEDDSLVMPGGQTYANGDDCGGEPGMVQVKVWDSLADTEGRLLEADFADFAPADGSLITIAFAPEGSEIPLPPSAGTQPTDVVPAPGDTVPQGAPSTLPTDEDAATGDDADGSTEEPIEGDDGTTATTGADDTSETTTSETTTSETTTSAP